MAERKNYGKLKEVIELPDLIGIQTESYANFLQKDVPANERKDQGLQGIFKEVFPEQGVGDVQTSLEFVKYELTEPKYSEVICLKDGETYQAGLMVTFRLRTSNGKEIKEEEIYMGDIPLMTPRGSFIINGAERVIVSQLHRSPGVSFEMNRHASGRQLYSYRVISDHGGWIEVQFDTQDYMYIYLDRKRRRRKFLISTFLRAFGYENNRELLDSVYNVEDLTPSQLAKHENISNLYTVEPVCNPKKADEEIFPELESLSEEALALFRKKGVKTVGVVDITNVGEYFVKCLKKDPFRTTEDAQKEIYRRMRPTDPATAVNAKQLFKNMFENPRRYNLGLVGRFKLNQRLGINVDRNCCVLTKYDIAAATRYLMGLRDGRGEVDDIDHLGRRRIRSVGELLYKICGVGLMRILSLMQDKIESNNGEELTVSKLVNNKALASVVRDFFGRNQLSQFMDQTNCLAELTNKRRLSALGPGGLTRERAGVEVRDIHPSHYGRLCPIETPEGPNIGLISSLALYAKVNEYGFIQSPYREVKNGVVTNKVVYLTADEEEEYYIAQANAVLNNKNQFVNNYVLCRYKGETGEFEREKVNYMDVSPKQMISAAAGLIPFLEHDDANRALMGANMQRQAVPLMKPERPLVGTGLEEAVARGSRASVCATENGIVAAVDATRIIVTPDGKMPSEKETNPKKVQRYDLFKFMRTNAATFFNQRPIVRSGDVVKKGQAIADGASTDGGELALGRNVLVAFMPWHGYNYEDAIIISQKLVANDTYSSIHVTLEEVVARENKLGPEEITRDIPNVGEDALRNLDTDGIVRVGAVVKPGDILVGKVTPKAEQDLAPEQRLMKAIFGEKSSDVKNSSLIVPHGTSGVVMEVRVKRQDDIARATKASKKDIAARLKETEAQYRSDMNGVLDELKHTLAAEFLGKKLSFAVTRLVAGETEEIIPADRKITKVMLSRLADSYDAYALEDAPDAKSEADRKRIDEIVRSYKTRLSDVERCRKEATEKVNNENGAQGRPQHVWVYIANKRRISIGDKMSGRHGNKGIVSKIVPVEDMPFMADGTPVDIILNPLGVPSRMNIGQVFETHAGYAAKILGTTVATPVFDGIPEQEVWKMLAEAKKKKVKERGWKLDEKTGKVTDEDGVDRTECFVDTDGKTRLYDGATGDAFAQRVMVGQIYMLKLDHLVANKIHARAVGPYSLVTQQPLGGKAQHGGQRFGEMEVWALEAYGAAYTLQEMLTVKSDDTKGRTRIYESIIDGDNTLTAGVPESFNVLMNEMKGLCLDVRVRRESGSQA